MKLRTKDKIYKRWIGGGPRLRWKRSTIDEAMRTHHRGGLCLVPRFMQRGMSRALREPVTFGHWISVSTRDVTYRGKDAARSQNPAAQS